jgi:hypothetical protein
VPVAARYCLELLPEEARRLYRERFEPPAAAELEDALRGVATPAVEDALARLAAKYPLTRTGVRAALLVADHYLERGWARRALGLYRDALRASPPAASASRGDDATAGGDRTRIEVRILVALRALGDTAAYTGRRDAMLEALEGFSPEGDFAERARAAIQRLETSSGPAPRPHTAVLPIEGETADGTIQQRLPSLGGLAYRFAWNCPWWTPSVQSSAAPETTLRRFEWGRTFNRSVLGDTRVLPASFWPAIQEDTIYVSGVLQFWKVDLETGNLKEWGRGVNTVEHPFYPMEALTANFREASVSPIYAPVVRDEQLFSLSIFGLQHRDEYMSYVIHEDLPTRALVVQDRRDGRVLWHTRDFTFGTADSPKPTGFVTPALILEDCVFAGGWVDNRHVSALVAAFDRRTGEPIWNTFLAANQMELTMFGYWAREPLAWVLVEDEGIPTAPPGSVSSPPWTPRTAASSG